ncbi:MAG TPA: VWA containing CoxE family protein, partial [Myxococcales bacterium LLY-WYZ-16_1]|nr:VWA containing CoxE family protein [Myxococcales bacterium LLY-WYZ-16_1]
MAEPSRSLLPFGDLFYGLRAAGVKVGPSDWMGLMQALEAGVVEPSLLDFYRVSRALLVKDEAQFDAFDQVFAAVFSGAEMPTPALQQVLQWLQDPLRRGFSEEDLATLEQLPLDELRRRFEE